jgi:hypothetical protein
MDDTRPDTTAGVGSLLIPASRQQPPRCLAARLRVTAGAAGQISQGALNHASHWILRASTIVAILVACIERAKVGRDVVRNVSQ